MYRMRNHLKAQHNYSGQYRFLNLAHPTHRNLKQQIEISGV